jgi:anti-sigma factor RsiW
MEDEIRGLLPHYYDGELSEDAARRVELHLPGCPDCRAELRELRLLSAALAPGAEPVTAAAADAFWQAFQPKLDDPKLGEQRAGIPWSAWLPGLILLALYAAFGVLLWAAPLLRLAGIDLAPPAPLLPLPLLAVEQLPLPGISLSNVLILGLFGSAGVLYLIWLGLWFSRHAAEASPAHS